MYKHLFLLLFFLTLFTACSPALPTPSNLQTSNICSNALAKAKKEALIAKNYMLKAEKEKNLAKIYYEKTLELVNSIRKDSDNCNTTLRKVLLKQKYLRRKKICPKVKVKECLPNPNKTEYKRPKPKNQNSKYPMYSPSDAPIGWKGN